MNLSKKHIKLAIQKDASMIACTPICSRLMYWKKKNRLSYDELAYLVNDGWLLYGNTVKDFIFHGKDDLNDRTNTVYTPPGVW